MKTNSIIVAIAIMLLLSTKAYSQVTTLSTVAGPTTEFLGWDGTGT